MINIWENNCSFGLLETLLQAYLVTRIFKLNRQRDPKLWIFYTRQSLTPFEFYIISCDVIWGEIVSELCCFNIMDYWYFDHLLSSKLLWKPKVFLWGFKKNLKIQDDIVLIPLRLLLTFRHISRKRLNVLVQEILSFTFR